MKKTPSEEAREFILSLIGPDKPFANKRKLSFFLGMNEFSKTTKFYKFLDGSQEPSFNILYDWIERLGGRLNYPDEVDTNLGFFRFIPKVEAVAGAGATLETSDSIIGYYAFKTDFLGREHISETQSVLMAVRGDSMEPLLYDGDTILVDRSDIQVLDGRLYVVTLGDELRVKRVFKSVSGLILRSENSRYPDVPVNGVDLEQFKVHGRVRWCGKML